jgi:hypothetical protein
MSTGKVLIKIAIISVKIIVWTIIGIFALYLFISYVAIPVGVPWVAKAQGTKLLGNPVSLGSARFNPFTLRFSLNDLKIQNNNKQLMVGFKKFWVDVSFISLLKKQYRVESLGLDGLEINVVLLPDSQINLLSLVPAQPQQPPSQPVQTPPPAVVKPAVSSQSAPALSPQPLPDALVDEIVLKNGIVTFTDEAIAPGFATRLSAMDLRITGISTKPDCQVKTIFTSNLDDKGRISTEALVKPFVQPLALEATFSLNDYAMRALTPYVGKYTGRAVESGGKLDVKVTYRIEDNKLKASHKILIQKFNFAEKIESKDALSLPFGLAIALLEDSNERIDISLPVSGDIKDPKFEYFHLVGQVARNFFMKLITAPFKALLSFIPSSGTGTEELSSISFAPGSSVLPDAEKEKLQLLVELMKDRPKLSMEINGSFDPEVDWKIMKTQAFENEFAAKRKDSTRTDFRLLGEMYTGHLGMHEYWALVRQHSVKGVPDEATINAEVRRQIIEKGAPDKTALDALGQVRAKAVYDVIIAEGFDAGRVKIGTSRPAQASMGVVPMEFTMTVFGEK